MQNTPQEVANLILQLLEDKVSYHKFMDSAVKYIDEDEDIRQLVDLIEHEPKKGGLFGATDKEYRIYKQNILNLVEKLKS